MNKQSQTERTRMIAEVNHLLAEKPWKLSEGFYAESSTLALFIDPLPSQVDGRFHAPLTILPLAGQSTDLENATVSLVTGSDTTLYFGQLNKRGQILFRDLAPGSYQCLPLNEPETVPAWQPHLSVLPPLAAAPTMEATDNDLYRFVNANQSLQIILRRAGDNYHLSFQAQGEMWHNKLLKFAWTPLFSTEQNPVLARTQPLLAVLTKDDGDGLFRADVNMGQASPAFVLSVSEQPWAWQWLSAEDEDMLRQSIASAANEQSRRGWQVAAAENASFTEILPLLHQALADMNSRPGRIWWRQAAAMGEQISRFINTLQVQIHAEIATFNGLPPTFHAPGLATAVTRSQNTAQPNPVKIVPLTAPSEAFTLRLIVGPVSGQQTTFSIQVIDTLLQQPLPRVRVNLFNDQKQLLEGDMTREDGLVTFHTLEPNTYLVTIAYGNEKLELPITFTADG
ncbi:MAG: hypothetical protein KC445_03885 [Anaerolineales bacterium]|nr:hypothetical protein [Anaerolineales bacterium]